MEIVTAIIRRTVVKVLRLENLKTDAMMAIAQIGKNHLGRGVAESKMRNIESIAMT